MPTGAGELEIERALEPPVCRLRLHGELDLATAPALRDTVVTEARRNEQVVVDLADVRFLDSTGLAALLSAAADARLHGSRMTVDSPPGSEARVVISLSGTGRVLGMAPA